MKNACPVHVNAKQKHFESGKNCSESSRMFLQVYPIIHGLLTNNNVNQKNMNCSSNAMEMEGAVILFQRSIQLHRFRYTSMLGDGDSKTHTKLGGKLRNWSAPIVFQNGWAQLAATLLPRKRHKGSR